MLPAGTWQHTGTCQHHAVRHTEDCKRDQAAGYARHCRISALGSASGADPSADPASLQLTAGARVTDRGVPDSVFPLSQALLTSVQLVAAIDNVDTSSSCTDRFLLSEQ